MDTTITATPRSDTGKGLARKLRSTGLVPAVIYGDGEAATPITVNPEPLVALFRKAKNRNTIVTIDVDGAKTSCLVREVQRHPLRRNILHIDFYKLSKGQKVRVTVPLTTKGKAAGAILGGRIRIVLREVPVSCDWESIPESLVVDVTPLEIGDMVRANEIAPPEGVKLLVDDLATVVSCYGRRASVKKSD